MSACDLVQRAHDLGRMRGHPRLGERVGARGLPSDMGRAREQSTYSLDIRRTSVSDYQSNELPIRIYGKGSLPDARRTVRFLLLGPLC